MSKFLKYVSSVMIAIFVAMAFAELAGVRVHHADSIKLVRVFSGLSVLAHEEHSVPGIHCRNDEAPIEHVVHDGASIVKSGTTVALFSVPAILDSFHPYVFPSSVIKTVSVEETVVSSLVISYHHSDRSPPISL